MLYLLLHSIILLLERDLMNAACGFWLSIQKYILVSIDHTAAYESRVVVPWLFGVQYTFEFLQTFQIEIQSIKISQSKLEINEFRLFRFTFHNTKM